MPISSNRTGSAPGSLIAGGREEGPGRGQVQQHRSDREGDEPDPAHAQERHLDQTGDREDGAQHGEADPRGARAPAEAPGRDQDPGAAGGQHDHRGGDRRRPAARGGRTQDEAQQEQQRGTDHQRADRGPDHHRRGDQPRASGVVVRRRHRAPPSGFHHVGHPQRSSQAVASVAQ